MKKAFFCFTVVVVLSLLGLFVYWQSQIVDMKAVAVEAQPCEERDPAQRSYDLKIRIESKEGENLSSVNFVAAYVFENEACRILPESEWGYYYNKETGKKSGRFYLSGGFSHGAYVIIRKDGINALSEYDSVLIVSKLALPADADVANTVEVTLVPYKKEIKESGAYRSIRTDLSEKGEDNVLTCRFLIGANDPR